MIQGLGLGFGIRDLSRQTRKTGTGHRPDTIQSYLTSTFADLFELLLDGLGLFPGSALRDRLRRGLDEVASFFNPGSSPRARL
jgi:hypothetical protein